MELPEYSQRIDGAGLEAHRDALVRAALPSVRLVATGSADAAPVGTSRLGGLPDLPLTTEWPTKNGKPLSFIAQVNLDDVHPFDDEALLPDSGVLSFFYDAISQSAWGFSPADRGSSAVIYSPPGATLIRRDAPESLDDAATFEPVRLTPKREMTFVPWESFTAEAVGMSRAETFQYAEIFWDDQQDDGVDLVHRLLGHPDHVQGDMQVECQLATNGLDCGSPGGYLDPRTAALRAGAGEWRLLLQVDSEEAAGMMWGDAGRIYFWIRREDLLAQRFDQSWLVLQCC